MQSNDSEAYVWRCPECGLTIDTWTYTDLVERGTPICMECDVDMELL